MSTKVITGVATFSDRNASGQKRGKSQATRQSGQIKNRRVNIQKTPKNETSHIVDTSKNNEIK